jgi:hypothetical protein
MKIKNVSANFFRSLLVISIALLLNACGPGTGGTGTGPVLTGSGPVTPPVNVPVIAPVVNPITVIVNAPVDASTGSYSGSSSSVSSSSPTTGPVIPATGGIDYRSNLNGLWTSANKQSEAFFVESGIVFRKGCFYYEYVGSWRANVDQNPDLTLIGKAEGFVWRVKLSDGKLSISVTDAKGGSLLEDNLLVEATPPYSKPTPTSVCSGQ